jgi:Flp pilus assembly protein TadD
MLYLAAVLIASTAQAAAATPAARRASGEQVRFGIEAARRGLWAEARFRFEKATRLDPANASALNNLAVACEQQGDNEQARAGYEQALKVKQRNAHIRQNYDLFREADEKRHRRSSGTQP